MSTNWLLFFALTLLVVISVFVPNIPMVADDVSAMTNTTLPEAPTVYEAATFSAGFLWSCMSFTYSSDFPYWLAIIFWVITFIIFYCAVRLIRGTS